MDEKNLKKVIYPVIVSLDQHGFVSFVPDFNFYIRDNGYTSLEGIIDMVSSMIYYRILQYQKDNFDIPKSSSVEDIKKKYPSNYVTTASVIIEEDEN